MNRVKLKSTKTERQVYYDNVPDLSLIPSELVDAYVSILAKAVIEHYKNKRTKKIRK